MFGTATMAAAPAYGAYAPAAYGAYGGAYAQAYAAPAVTQVPSYVAPPMMAAPAAFQQVAQMAAPVAPPPNLTAGLPTPEQIAQQKVQFAAALDKQLKDAIAVVQKETEIEKQMIKFNAEKQIALYNMQVDEKLTEMSATAEEMSTFSDCELKKAMIERTLQLNAQAQGLVFDYNMRATQQELAQRQAQFEQQFMAEENKLAQEYAATLDRAGPAAMGMGVGMPGAPMGAVESYVAAPAMYAAPATYAAEYYVEAPAAYAAPAYAAPATYGATYAAPATYATSTAYAAPTVYGSTAYAAPTTAYAAPSAYAAGGMVV